MKSGSRPFDSSSGSSRRPPSSGSHSPDRPLGVTIICALGILGFFLGFIPILDIASMGGSAGAALGLVLLVFNFAHLAIIVGLLNMSATALTWAYVYYGIDVVLDLVSLNILGMIISIIILAYLTSVSHKFD